MILWLALIVLCSATAVAVSIPLIRRFEDTQTPSQDTAVYRDQLQEVDRDLKAGNIAAPEAQNAKFEIGRRIDTAMRNISPPQPLKPLWRRLSLVFVAAFVILGSTALYGFLGSPNLPSAEQTAKLAPADMLIGKLQDRLKTNPDDKEAWRMLGWAMAGTQHWQESVDAYAKASALAPENTDLKSALVESIVQVANGTVPPKAQALIAEVLAKDPKDLRARFYDALGHEQNGDRQGAFDRWSALLMEAPADATWRSDVRQRISDLAKALGKPDAAAPQISAEKQASITTLTPADQRLLIEGMVQKLADKLKDDPQNLEGWLRLIRSQTILQAPDKAKAALAMAQKTFSSDQAALAELNALATELGLN